MEQNVRILILNCEEMVKDTANYWKVKKYIKALDTMIEELIDAGGSRDLTGYATRIDALKQITNYIGSPKPFQQNKTNSFYNVGDSATREIRQVKESKNFSNLRNELMNDAEIRQRKLAQTENMVQAMQYYDNAQEKIAENMLLLTGSLREQTETANKIIKRDTEIVNKSSDITNKNLSSLSTETSRLSDHSKKAWKCWMWLMIATVMVVFIAMVMLMKFAKKRT